MGDEPREARRTVPTSFVHITMPSVDSQWRARWFLSFAPLRASLARPKGLRLDELDFPEGASVALIVRGDRLVPKGATTLEPGDHV